MREATYDKTLPVPNELDTPHWEGLRRHELLVQRCADCGMHLWYPGEACASCHGLSLEWTSVEPVGEVYSFTVQYQPTGSRWDPEIPYASAIVQLRDAPEITMGAWLIDVDPEAVHIGMPVVGDFLDATDAISLLRFKPA